MASRVLVLLASLLWPWSRSSAQNADSLRRLLQSRVEDGRAVGVIIALVRADGEPIVVAVGNGRAGKPPDEHSVFEIGSITKAFTGILLADMVNRGEVRLDQPVAELLPADVRMPTRNGNVITLQHLATHTSGLPRLPLMAPKDMTNPYADYTVQQLYGFLEDVQLPRDPAAAYEYSNLGVGLLGHVLALRAGRSYETLVRERILEPLGMTSTAITLTAEMRERMAQGHDEAGHPASLWDLPTFAGAGALRSTLRDMRRFIAAASSPADNSLGRAIVLSMEPRFTVNPNLAIGLGWHRVSVGRDTIVWHNGGTGGFHSFAGFNGRTKASVVMLANSPHDNDDIARHLILPALPLATFVRRVEVKLPVTTLREYAGTYRLAPNFAIAVTEESGALYIQATDQPRVPAFAEALDKFFLRIVDAQIEFGRDRSGKVVELTLVQNGRHKGVREP